jgi:RNA polymerase sigma-70 factor (ECF subfamily)
VARGQALKTKSAVIDFAQELGSQIPRLRRYARALTRDASWADDLVQDTMERALGRRWLLRANSNLSAWLFTMLYRLYLNDVARYRMMRGAQDENFSEPSASSDIGIRLDLQRALDQLGPDHRAVVLLIGLEQMSYKETASILGIPIGTVMSRLMRGREQLRRLMVGDSEETDSALASTHLTRVK